MNSANSSFSSGAEVYLDGYPETDQADFYVWHLQRGGSSSLVDYTITVPSQLKYGPIPTEPTAGLFSKLNSAEVIPLDSNVFVGFRAYVNPATGVGPSWNEIIYDRVIKFTPSGEQSAKN
mmetsp:Transcript_2701/g.5790  ORF Transcript_2701/g.5790 Transcript_2701/m.5790 type:complete len:120 (-) Transcript_2701:27-386(-)